MIQVSAAIIKDETDKILICQRGEGGICEYLWEFPGGKLEIGETPQDCLVRECMEELDIDVEVEELFAETTYAYPDKEIAFSFFYARIVKGEPAACVHKSIKWVLKEELSAYQFCPADVAITDKLLGI